MRKAFVALLTVGMLFALVPAAAAAPPAHAKNPNPTPPMHAGRHLSATLTGAAEVPILGDSDGSGTAHIWLNQGQERVCFKLTWKDIVAPFAAHIHAGAAGIAGPAKVTLSVVGIGSSMGCVSATKDLIKDIRQNPQNYYVNIHNSAFPGGAIRGQLSK